MPTRRVRWASLAPLAIALLWCFAVLLPGCGPASPKSCTLDVTTIGQGSVTPSGVIRPAGTVVSLEAHPATGWRFAGWSGGLTGTANPASCVIADSMLVTATFVCDSPFSVAFTAPETDGWLWQGTTVSADANVVEGCEAPASVSLYVDNSLKGTLSSAPYAWQWDCASVADGTHTLRVVAADGLGFTAESTRDVTVRHYTVAVSVVQDAALPMVSVILGAPDGGAPPSAAVTANGASVDADGSAGHYLATLPARLAAGDLLHFHIAVTGRTAYDFDLTTPPYPTFARYLGDPAQWAAGTLGAVLHAMWTPVGSGEPDVFRCFLTGFNSGGPSYALDAASATLQSGAADFAVPAGAQAIPAGVSSVDLVCYSRNLVELGSTVKDYVRTPCEAQITLRSSASDITVTH